MKFMYVRLKGYAGIYNGLGLNEIQIDFSKGKHSVILISGINGCGKSTLMKALSVFPDSSSDYLSNMSAEKELHILHQDVVYSILISSPFSSSGRGVTKASIQKNGIELNPNGNISSYKDIIFSEFELDGNFALLTHLSSEDRGLADKTPAERKKFMSARIASVEVYNNIYKNLSKKSLIFKSHLNNLHSKIQGIGDEGAIRTSLSSLKARQHQIENDEIALRDQISQLQVQINDGNFDPQEQEQFLKLEEKAKLDTQTLNRSKDDLEKRYANMQMNPFDVTELHHTLERKSNLLIESEKNILLLEENISRDSSRVGSLAEQIIVKEYNKQTLTDQIHYENVRNLIEEKEKINREAREYLQSMQIDNIDNVRAIDIEQIQDVLARFFILIDEFYQIADSQEIFNGIFSDEDTNILIDSLRTRLESLSRQKEEQLSIINNCEKDKEIISILERRPAECNLNDCAFISKAYEVSQLYKETSLEVTMEEAYYKLEDIYKDIRTQENRMYIADQIVRGRDILYKISELLKQNQRQLSLIQVTRNLLEEYKDRVQNNDSFQYLKAFMNSSSSEIASALDQYHSTVTMLIGLSAEERVQKDKQNQLLVINKEIVELEAEKETLNEEIRKNKNLLENHNKMIKSIKASISDLESIRKTQELYDSAKTELKETSEKLESVRQRSKGSLEAVQKQSIVRDQLESLLNSKSEVSNQIAMLQNKLSMLEEYKMEYQIYSSKYERTDLIKRYTSPTQSGIQNVFIQTYMSKTLTLANQILAMIFNGEYHLLDFVINDKEFRIPFIGSGLAVDDVSSGSTSQICIIGMAISMALMYQASTKYNISRLDEIDGGLDSKNRLDFINIIYQIIQILNIEQTFIISHSVEIELSNVDVIRLRTHSDTETCNGNLIYDFNTVIRGN